MARSTPSYVSCVDSLVAGSSHLWCFVLALGFAAFILVPARACARPIRRASGARAAPLPPRATSPP
eukprot:8145988-Pyramimonas_sp.AAC.1